LTLFLTLFFDVVFLLFFMLFNDVIFWQYFLTVFFDSISRLYVSTNFSMNFSCFWRCFFDVVFWSCFLALFFDEFFDVTFRRIFQWFFHFWTIASFRIGVPSILFLVNVHIINETLSPINHPYSILCY
jgi:hypothetical protein